ncbi:MAG: endonuclease domain-containing protein [Patescibacteria group bacterium]
MKRQFVFNATRMKERRKDLRRRQTNSEELLWNELRAHKLGYKFKRQYSLGNYVADFFCREKKLAIEVEGEIHKRASVQKYDTYRMRYLEALGVRVIRIKNEEIIERLDWVLKKIRINLRGEVVK